ncbi:MAG: hypothetical protein ABSG41_29830 [Bryobacteraceae bacterium]|jgi:hypothetical protein
MRELHGVWIPVNEWKPNIKALALLFDKLYVFDLGMMKFEARREKPVASLLGTDITFLEKRGFFEECGFPFPGGREHKPPDAGYLEYIMPKIADLGYSSDGKRRLVDMVDSTRKGHRVFLDILAYFIAVERDKFHHTVPLFYSRFPLLGATTQSQTPQTLLRVASKALPVPDDMCAWQDILDFKEETRDKQWGFRRFLQSLATKQHTEAEIRDEIEWMVNEYTKAMALHRIKASQSLVDVFIVSPLEIIENLVKLNWSKIAKGALTVRTRKVELMEAEMKAPGRECAYVFDARQRFGRSG